MSQLAIRLYVEGTVPIIRILRMANANEVIRAQQYSHVIAGTSTDSLEQFRTDREDLEAGAGRPGAGAGGAGRSAGEPAGASG